MASLTVHEVTSESRNQFNYTHKCTHIQLLSECGIPKIHVVIHVQCDDIRRWGPWELFGHEGGTLNNGD